MELTIINNKGEKAGTFDWQDDLTATKASRALLHEVVVAHLAAQRSGSHSTRTRSQVSGGGIKPWKQKGTGRARSGSTRSPLWRHGGIIFGPNPRNYRQDLPQSKKKTAFRMALRELIAKERLQVVEPIALSEPKTKHVAAIYQKWNAPHNSVLVVDKLDPNFTRAARNIPNVRVIDVDSLNTYDCLGARRLFVTKPALNGLVTRISKYVEKN